MLNPKNASFFKKNQEYNSIMQALRRQYISIWILNEPLDKYLQ